MTAAPAKASTDAHIPELDGFRAFSIIAVLAAHMLPLTFAGFEGNKTAGYMGMSVFFALSGFLITRFLWESDNITQFFIRRLARIVPLVVLVSTIYCLILEYRPDSFVAANLYILNYWHSAIAPSVSPWWSLGVEMHFYLAIGLAVLFFGRSGFWLVPIAAFAVLVMRISVNAFGDIQTHLRVDEILSGSMLAMLWLNRAHFSAVWSLLPKLFWPGLILWAASCWPASDWLGYLRPYTSALLIGSVMAMPPGWQKSLLSHKTLAYVAAISFALYVWHSPFRHGWFDAGSDLERYLFKRPLALVCVFTLAHLSTFYFEKPILRRMRNLGARPQESTA